MEPSKFTITLTDPEASNGGGTGGIYVVGNDKDYIEILAAIDSENSLEYNQADAESLLISEVKHFTNLMESGMDWMEVGFAGSGLVLQFTTRVNE